MRQGRGTSNFDLLRLVGATLVLVVHSFELTINRRAPITAIGEAVGEIAVVTFFVISGFLITRSWAYDPKPLSFAIKRVLRLMPALLISLLLTALLLGPLTTTLPLSTYFAEPATKAYILSNATFQTFVQLPGVFAQTPFPNVVNQPLWTLPVEVKAYCVVAVLGLLGVVALSGRRRLLVPAIALFFALLAIDSTRAAIPLGDRVVATIADVQGPPEVVAIAHAGVLNELPRLVAAYMIGASLFVLARWIPLRWSIAGALAVAWAVVAATIGPDAVPLATALALPYVVVLLAYRTSHLVRLPRRMGDYSYGLYIFAFPIQQAVILWLTPSSGLVTVAVAGSITLALAVASWHFIEAPSLTLKQRIRQPLEREGAAAVAHPLERIALQPDGPAPVRGRGER
ncbi:MAG TPA: acyltransferase [Conexibacter sp.]